MAASGIAVACVTGQAANEIAVYQAEHATDLPILSDPRRQVIKDYGVYHLIGLDAFRMARPSAFLIDGNAKVSFLYVGSHQADRPSPQVLVSAAANLLSRR